MKFQPVFAFLLPTLAHALPLLSTTSSTTTTSSATLTDCIAAESPFPVQIDPFAQLVATHWQFEHLDSIISKTYKEISTQFQRHVQINVKSSQQEVFQSSSFNSIDTMDVEILKAQIFGALQAHTEGNLPLAWDRLADRLGKQAIESFIRKLLITHCSDVEQEDPLADSADHIDSKCLATKAVQLSSEFDRYIAYHLTHIFKTLDEQVLPELLEHTSRDLEDVLNYFNSAFLQGETSRLTLDVLPWKYQPSPEETKNQETASADTLHDRLLHLATEPVSYDHHPNDFFSHFACLARA
ncbi:uncharacterized protein BYT42DRAFT_569851 [Radiomyces spectabilis]|uniref:uncharacterized protein n=1 Tax=Radiomyces spectabilis TaxID=64574 RepID=UPI002220836A|nr:uncharacterized protein BYT42DRAFT_569851 [Radiomyces spectabilis]KAI8379737.1 hypothetical protein BYT42DRAFT_569851 [Radiomyces spectabilis]